MRREIPDHRKVAFMQRKGTVGSKGSALLRREDGDAMREHAGSFGPTTVAAKFVVTDGKAKQTFQVSGVTGKRPHTRTNRIALAVAGALSEASDDKWIEIGDGSSISFNFSKQTIPLGAKVAKVMLYVEHYEDESFPPGKLKWEIGKGWPDNPMVWFWAYAQVHEGKQKEATDSWDITSFGNTSEKINALQLRIVNEDSISRKKTFVNYIRVVVEWDWPSSISSTKRGVKSRPRSREVDDDGMVLIRR